MQSVASHALEFGELALATCDLSLAARLCGLACASRKQARRQAKASLVVAVGRLIVLDYSRCYLKARSIRR